MKGLLSNLPIPSNKLIGWPWTEETDPTTYDKNKEWPKITIITPSFNQAEYIEETIRSILLQNYPNLEYIIIDGGSTDGSVEIIQKYEPWLNYWVSEKDRGQSHAINKGLKKATGDIIQWINSDDFFRENALFKIASFFDENPTKNCLITPTWVFGINNRVLEETPIFPSLAKTVSASRINQPGTYFRAKIFRKITPLSEDLHYMMDLHMWLKYLILYGTNQVEKQEVILVNFREHQASKTISSELKFLIERFYLVSVLEKTLSGRKMTSTELKLYKGMILNFQNDTLLKGVCDCLFYWLKFFRKEGIKHDIPKMNLTYLKGFDKLRYILYNLHRKLSTK